MIEWCVTECGNMECPHNEKHRKTKAMGREVMVYMRDNQKRGCLGYKRNNRKAEKAKKEKK